MRARRVAKGVWQEDASENSENEVDNPGQEGQGGKAKHYHSRILAFSLYVAASPQLRR